MLLQPTVTSHQARAQNLEFDTGESVTQNKNQPRLGILKKYIDKCI